jgi:hypothetical protein
MSEHTGGPWQLRGFNIYDNNKRLVANAGGEYKMDVDRANAKLIAAAPDLLRACAAMELAINKAVSGIRQYSIDEMMELMQQAQAAIQKAREG